MGEKPRVVLYVNDVQEGEQMESVEEAKQKAEPHIKEGLNVHIVVARWLKPLETLTYRYESADWSSQVG